jgi:diacylglycerol kinase
MMLFFRRTLPAIIVFITGTVMAVLYYSPHPTAEAFYEESSRWVRIIANCALLLGVVSLLSTHWRKIRSRAKDWGYSIVLYASFLSILVLGLWRGIESETPADWIFQNVKVPLESTMFALLAFFIASAAFRAFRVRSFPATVMLITAIVMMIGRIPFGGAIPSPSDGGEPVLFQAADWLLSVPTNAAKRAILLGVAFSTVVTSLRIIAGLERSYFGKGD